MKSDEKVFCLGFHKTATTSLARALKVLGYKVVKGVPGEYLKDPNFNKIVREIYDTASENYDAFADGIWPCLYKEMDKKYPNSKFILVIRDSQDWIKSVVADFGTHSNFVRKWIYGDEYGCPKGNEDVYIKIYEQHNAEVMDYFNDRPDDLLVIYLSKKELSWEKLCPFLNKEIPDIPFFQSNQKKRRERKVLLQKVKKLLNRLNNIFSFNS